MNLPNDEDSGIAANDADLTTDERNFPDQRPRHPRLAVTGDPQAHLLLSTNPSRTGPNPEARRLLAANHARTGPNPEACRLLASPDQCRSVSLFG